MVELKPRVSVQYVDKATVVTLTDEKILEDMDVQALKGSIDSVVEQAERVNLVLDFRNVRFLSSSVLGLLIRVSRKIAERKGSLRLCGIHPKIYEIFKITRLTKVFDIYEDVGSATKNLSEPG
ncbi:MAG: STAS domain-containing protein [Phycisphaerales bacterium]|nr:MAG: STAS domain-containing protein [Phycisphaerales bacterium]